MTQYFAAYLGIINLCVYWQIKEGIDERVDFIFDEKLDKKRLFAVSV